MKKKILKTMLLVVAAMTLCLGAFIACDDNKEKTLDPATDFTYNFDTGAYSFTGVSDASFYYVKIYNKGDKSDVVGISDKISATSSNKYTGTVSDIVPPGDYDAYVVASANGYTSSESKKSGTCITFVAPSLTAYWGADADKNVTIKVTVTAGDKVSSSFTVTVKNASGTVLYTNPSATTTAFVVTAADLGVTAIISDTTSTSYVVYTVTAKANATGNYSASSEKSTTPTTERGGWPF